MEAWTEGAACGRSKEPWLKTCLELPQGIPSHDTFGRVFSLNLALLRRLALHLLKQETSVKRSLIAKRLSAGWDNNCLCKVMRAV